MGRARRNNGNEKCIQGSGLNARRKETSTKTKT
jgi:hypothetical protein